MGKGKEEGEKKNRERREKEGRNYVTRISLSSRFISCARYIVEYSLEFPLEIFTPDSLLVDTSIQYNFNTTLKLHTNPISQVLVITISITTTPHLSL